MHNGRLLAPQLGRFPLILQGGVFIFYFNRFPPNQAGDAVAAFACLPAGQTGVSASQRGRPDTLDRGRACVPPVPRAPPLSRLSKGEGDGMDRN